MAYKFEEIERLAYIQGDTKIMDIMSKMKEWIQDEVNAEFYAIEKESLQQGYDLAMWENA